MMDAIETPILIGVLFATAAYLVMQPSFARILFGLMVLSNAANLLVLNASGSPTHKHSPIVNGEHASGFYVDPLPQALILTAIVIGFGVMTYVVFLFYRIFLDSGTTNARELYSEDRDDLGELSDEKTQQAIAAGRDAKKGEES